MEINVHQSLNEISHAIEMARLRDQIDVIALPREDLQILLNKILGHATIMGVSREEAMKAEWIRFKGIYFVIVEEVKKGWRPDGEEIFEEYQDPFPPWWGKQGPHEEQDLYKYQQWIKDFVRFKTKKHGYKSP